ncbi:Uncharacterized protein BP5553_04793 [Venustampulla echinocandica]|uniref:tRNA wybutosine-synthesizing protein 4 n=1 Tax=Venustampulla echinocandica TaxID=2656787 RepID=A0A370TPA3_9HELO|nr:Uncharacterized protein BP5553_04793 [Venustampulla echinocandica]RDL37360.1 Uncharacterized protein BP5553_04793 [Venustampulla echinocandica]
MAEISGNSRERRTPKASKEPNQQVRDDLIMGTNNSSIVSKRSVERLYFPDEAHFFRYFVKKPLRRSPLINRGYWLRMKAIDHVVRQFLDQQNEKRKVVINLGCGYDPLPWQCLSRYPASSENVMFIDVDYKDLMIRKRETVERTPELQSLFTNIRYPESGDILLSSDQYLQIGCDLRDLTHLDNVLKSTLDLSSSQVLLVAEVSITYMEAEHADNLIKWASGLPSARFCLLEQLLPDGIDHPFAQTMMAHFDKLKTPLKAVQKYPSTSAQSLRFESLGWTGTSVQNLWELWASPEFLSSADRKALDAIEPFDEWEEFALFGCHYILLVADNLVPSSNLLGICGKLRTGDPPATTTLSSSIVVAYSDNPQGHGCRRFAAGLPLKGSKRAQTRVGNFAGMGLKSRIDSYDVYDRADDQGAGLQYEPDRSSIHPSSRMCHTITDLGDAGALLVGGRTSPDNGLVDCWLYHKWVDTWERVDDAPHPLYRHQAVDLGCGYALISTGRINSRTMSHEYLVWSRHFGWVQCQLGSDQNPPDTYGATFSVSTEIPPDLSKPGCGILAGGMCEDGLLQPDIWEWELQDFATQHPILHFRISSDFARDMGSRLGLVRFGASVVNHQQRTYIVGGIAENNILKASDEICAFGFSSVPRMVTRFSNPFDNTVPRPLLIGTTAMSTGGSLLTMGGSAVCFSFGTFSNKGCYTIHPDKEHNDVAKKGLDPGIPPEVWSYMYTSAPQALSTTMNGIAAAGQVAPKLTLVPRIKIHDSNHFHKILQAGVPVIIEGSNIGPCTTDWTADYLKEKVGSEREVVVHQGTTTHLNFKTKNFTYTTKTFGDFIDSVEAGEKLYLRSLSSDNAKEIPANLDRDFSSLAADFQLPNELEYVTKSIHSSPFRISGPVIMWLHYDVMANILCQIRGQKRLVLFPPTDVMHLGFEPGSSSSSINVFEQLQDPSLCGTHPHEVILREGDILFLPSLWLHTAEPTSGMSVAVNVFFRDLQAGYAAGKDVYGNRDLQAYEKGRLDINKIIKSLDGLPGTARSFYLQRLVAEFQQKSFSP